MPRKIEISHRTIIFIAVFLLGLRLVVQIKDVLLMLFMAFIIMSALNPAVDHLEKLKIPRALAILMLYLLLLVVIGVTLGTVVPPLVSQTGNLVLSLPDALSRIAIFHDNQQAITEQVLGQIGSLPQDLLRVTVNLFGNILSIFTVLVISFYLLLERANLNKYLAILLGKNSPDRVLKTINEIERRLGGWVRGELFLMLAVGLVTYVGLLILGIDNALPLAIIAGLLEIVPNIGPTLSAVPAILIALTIHPFKAVATAALYFLVQLIENHALVPNIMRRAVGVNPLVSIVGLIIGLKIYGPMGAIMSIPVIIVIHTIILNLQDITWRE